MQVWALGWGNAEGLLKFNRFSAASFSGMPTSTPV
jgi:hypothetical protein